MEINMMFFLRLKEILYGQSKSSRLWYEMLQNGLLDSGSVERNVDPWLFMSKTVICVVYMNDFIFWESPQFDIDNFMKYFKEDGPNYNWDHPKW